MKQSPSLLEQIQNFIKSKHELDARTIRASGEPIHLNKVTPASTLDIIQEAAKIVVCGNPRY